jgi:hypothetical protein
MYSENSARSSSETLRGLARSLGLLLRRAGEDDFDRIAAIARHSFPEPFGWWNNPRATAHYRSTHHRFGRLGELRVAVAHAPGAGPAAYAYYQIRSDGDLYLAEIAARPPGGRLALAGSALLGFAVSEGLASGIRGRATLGISATDAKVCADPFRPGRARDLSTFYSTLGYRLVPFATGYTRDSQRRPGGGLWMEGAMEEVLERVCARLAEQVFGS